MRSDPKSPQTGKARSGAGIWCWPKGPLPDGRPNAVGWARSPRGEERIARRPGRLLLVHSGYRAADRYGLN